jgi:hypothetical protein
MPIDMGVAKGHIDIDFRNLQTGVASATKQLKRLSSEYNLQESSLKKLEAGLKQSGCAFQQAAQHSQYLSNELQSAKAKAETYNRS